MPETLAYALSALLAVAIMFGSPVLLLIIWRAHLRGLARVRGDRRG